MFFEYTNLSNLSNQTILISIEGNIGSGKSTLLDQLRLLKLNRPHIVIQEDVKNWTSVRDTNDQTILEKYYHDQKKYGYCFQSLVLFSRIQQLTNTIKENPGHIIITERCHLSDCKLFAEMLYKKGCMTSIEWCTYCKILELLESTCNVIQLSGIIYNQASIDICRERITKRNRKGEEQISMDYLNDLHKRHEEWLTTNTTNNIPILILNGNIDYQHNEYKEQLEKCKEFINQFIQ